VTSTETRERARNVVLLGIGHTNAHIVKEWAHDPIPDCKLICISKFPTATYSGMLPGTLGWQFSDEEMRIDLESLCDRAGAELILADTTGLNLSAGELCLSDRSPIRFDALSVGVGSMPAGWREHSGSPLLVPIKPMQTFLQRLNDRLEQDGRSRDQLQHVAIVGGGVASVEIALCLHEQCRKRDFKCQLRIEIFTSSDRVAPDMSSRSVRRIEKLLSERDIAIQTGHRVTEVGESDFLTDDGQRHQSDCVIWATGAAPPPVLERLGLRTDDRGFIATSDTLQSLSDPRIFAVGDSGTVLASPSPKAGVYAVRQIPILSNNLRALFDKRPMKHFAPQQGFLKILNTGDGNALLEYGWFTVHARWCLTLKNWIDKRFISSFQSPRQ
tara:strand:- start:105328 stop:106482 length:1155 start_codon:yes stop_codon:yes gene_type:complete